MLQISNLLFFSWLVFFLFFFGGIYCITPDFYSLPEKVVVASIVTGECGEETIDDNNSKTIPSA